MNIPQVIDRLKELDLKITSSEVVTSLLRQLGDILVLGIEIPVGDRIIRSVPNDSLDKNREFETEISYISKPGIRIRENRASIEGRPVFYGCTTRGNQDF